MAGRNGQLLRLFDQAGVDRRRTDSVLMAALTQARRAAHHRAERAALRIVGKQRFGHLRLYAEHVDQEPQGAKVAGNSIKNAGLGNALSVHGGGCQAVNVVAHAQQRGRRVVHAQHREHAAHGGQVPGYLQQRFGLGGLAKEFVDQLLGIRQRRAQFLHHAAHGLPVRNAAVQLLHPRLKRFWPLALPHIGEPVRETSNTFRLTRVVEVCVFEHGLDVEQAGRNLHRQGRRRCSACGLALVHSTLQLVRKNLAQREQALQRITHERKLLGQAGQPMHFTAGHGRPGFFRGGDTFAGLGNPGRVELAQRAAHVVHRHVVGQPVGLPNSGQTRRLVAVVRQRALCAEEEQVLRKTVRDFALTTLEHAKLGQQARCHAL